MMALSLPWAFVLRDFLVARSYRIGFIMTLGGTVGSVLIFYFLSRAIGPAVGSQVAAYGSDYFGFVVIGIAFTQVVTVGLGAIGGSVRQGQVTGTLELMLISPTRASTALVSSGLYSHIAAAGTIVVYLAVGVLLGLRFGQANVPVALAAFILLVISCNALGLIGAAAVLVLKQGNPVNWIVSGASLVLGGVFYPRAPCPLGWRRSASFCRSPTRSRSCAAPCCWGRGSTCCGPGSSPCRPSSRSTCRSACGRVTSPSTERAKMAASPSSESIAAAQRVAAPAPSLGLGREEEVLCLASRVAPDDAARARLATLLDGRFGWDRLWRLGHLHEVLPLVVTSVTALAGDVHVPEAWSSDAQRRRSATLLQNRSLLAELLTTLDAMAAAGVEAIPVKGLVLTESLYGNLALRPAGDIDVLVKPEDLPAARDALRGLGYEQAAVLGYEERHHPFHDPPYYRPGQFRPTALELHHGLAAPRQFRMDAASLWQRSRTTELFGRQLRVLGPEDTLLHLAVHRARAPLRLRWLVDVAELMRRSGPALDVGFVLAQARAIGARTTLGDDARPVRSPARRPGPAGHRAWPRDRPDEALAARTNLRGPGDVRPGRRRGRQPAAAPDLPDLRGGRHRADQPVPRRRVGSQGRQVA